MPHLKDSGLCGHFELPREIAGSMSCHTSSICVLPELTGVSTFCPRSALNRGRSPYDWSKPEDSPGA